MVLDLMIQQRQCDLIDISTHDDNRYVKAGSHNIDTNKMR